MGKIALARMKTGTLVTCIVLLNSCFLSSEVVTSHSNKDISDSNVFKGSQSNTNPTYRSDGSNIASLIQQIDETLILGYLENITAFGPRVTGTQACTDAGDYIYNKFKNMELDVRYQAWSYQDYEGRNVEGTHQGINPSEAGVYIICAHYDTSPDGPGVDDDGSGVAAVLAAASIMHHYTFNYTIRFVLFSGEEQFLLGSHEYVEEAVQQNENIIAVLNLDMIGYAITENDGSKIQVFYNYASTWLKQFTCNVNQIYHEYIDLTTIPRLDGWGSDHWSFWDAGYDAIFYFQYNSSGLPPSEDTFEYINLTYIAKVLRLSLATLVMLAGLHDLLLSNVHGPYVGAIGESIHFTGSATGGILPYSWSWDFGDNHTSTDKNPVYSYTAVGTYMVALTVTDYMGNSSTDMTSATIEEPGSLQAEANGPYSGLPGEYISFSGMVTGGVSPYNWSWNFGDNTTAYLQNPTHTYSRIGNYSITLTVTDDVGNRNEDTSTAVIHVGPIYNINKNVYYWTIQSAVDGASAGDTIVVSSGIYHEHISINKTITLTGEDRQGTIIDGDGSDSIISISADGVNINGFTLLICNGAYVGILTTSNFNRICNNTIIGLNGITGFVGIEGLQISNSVLSDNTINLNDYGMFGIYIIWSSNNTISKNLIRNNWDSGIYLGDSNDNIITENVLSNNSNGGSVIGGSNNIFRANDFTTANNVGLYIMVSSQNIIYHNNFVNNAQHAYEECTNIWYNPVSHQGNYWDDFDTPDEGAYDDFQGMNQDQSGSDGIVDLGSPKGGLNPYIITGGSNQDIYPLMHLFVLGDMNVDGVVDFGDINPFVLAFSNPTTYQQESHILPIIHGDINQDGLFDFGDLNPFIALLYQYND